MFWSFWQHISNQEQECKTQPYRPSLRYSAPIFITALTFEVKEKSSVRFEAFGHQHLILTFKTPGIRICVLDVSKEKFLILLILWWNSLRNLTDNTSPLFQSVLCRVNQSEAASACSGPMRALQITSTSDVNAGNQAELISTEFHHILKFIE